MARFDPTRALEQQLAELKGEIRAAPAQASLRIYLFQLLAVMGQWRKALEALQLAAQLDPKAQPMARTYREAIACEMLRADVFAGRRSPSILGEPPPWMGLLTQALVKLGKGDAATAAALRAEAFEQAPTSSGRLDDEPFEWIADADSRLGPVCELLVKGSYYWLPFASIRNIGFEKPQDLRDFVWTACEVTLSSGGTLAGFIPTRYPGSEEAADGLRLARRTEWTDLGDGHASGLGQRLWLADGEDHALLDVRRLQIDAA
ncbi:MAG TPA: type VI secretion system accessory protein TagJ [Rubrivivax sp.]|nr:virulence protein SciE type [Burkholderiales bacterium]HNT39597.1 type VI secretion system accessory protein TagJ [Rubrivivax sp.]